ncbi:MAG: TetR/AcrR family transcriptional regulator [Bacteroidota bacterium]|jgi:AcrR family transcriptional regulator
MGITERKEREKESRKESIIDAAQKVFFEKGLLLSTMDEIAETAELAKGTLYLYYHSKEDLYLAVMMRGLMVLKTMFDEVITKNDPVVQTMIRLADKYTAFYHTHKNYFRMLHFFNTPQLHKQVSDEMMQSCDRFNQQLWTSITGIINRGITEGIIRNDLIPIEIAVVLWTNASSLLMRIDSQYEMFQQKMNIDLNVTLQKSNMLMLESILTEHGKLELSRVMK